MASGEEAAAGAEGGLGECVGNDGLLPHWAVCDFLGDSCYRTVRVGDNGLIEFQDRDMTGSDRRLRYAGVVAKPEGVGGKLMPGVRSLTRLSQS